VKVKIFMSQLMLLTDKAIAKLPFAAEGQYKVRDAELKGFFVRVGKRSKTYMVQGEHWRDGFREFSAQKKLGEFGCVSARDARSKAKELLVSFGRGERPGIPMRVAHGAITLRAAWERYRDAHMIRKGRAERTVENYRDYIERHLADWLDLPLAKLGIRPDLVIERHERLTARNGPYVANGVMKALRAIYNHALKGNRDLPAYNPVLAVDWNPEYRRDTGMGTEDLPGWFSELAAISNPVRREFHLLSLLTGSRPAALKSIRVSDIDFKRRILHIPKPKGGIEKAFDIPMSHAIMKSVIRTLRVGGEMYPVQSFYWLFPSDSASGHMSDTKEDRSILSKWGNDLRQTYRTLAQVAEVSELDIHLLMNHSLRGVNAGYITRDKLLRGHLRKQQERISSLILASLENSDTSHPF
jgi:integrase